MRLLFLLYVAAALFLAGNALRILRALRMPRNLRWELYPIPRGPKARQRYGGSYFEESEWWTRRPEPDRSAELIWMLKEIFLLRGVWNHFRGLWLWSWLMHTGLYLWMCVFALGVAAAVSAEAAHRIVPWIRGIAQAGMLAGLCGTIGVALLRLTLARLQQFTTRETLLNLGLLAAVFATGSGALLTNGEMVEQTVSLLRAFAGAGAAPAIPRLGEAHVALVAAFLSWFPFTHMTHMYMKYFAYHEVRWADRAAAHDARIPAETAANLQRTVSWSGAHIGAGSGTTWQDAARPERGKNA